MRPRPETSAKTSKLQPWERTFVICSTADVIRKESDVNSLMVVQSSWFERSFQSGRAIESWESQPESRQQINYIKLYRQSNALKRFQYISARNYCCIVKLARFLVQILRIKPAMVRVLWNLEDPNSRAGGVSSTYLNPFIRRHFSIKLFVLAETQCIILWVSYNVYRYLQLAHITGDQPEALHTSKAGLNLSIEVVTETPCVIAIHET